MHRWHELFQKLINDEHDYGNREPNLLVGQLPRNVSMVRRPHMPNTPRKMVQKDPYGIIMVGKSLLLPDV
jgi:hypothetical protein